jgi:hypothetical protein
MNLLFVGELNPYGADPRFALYHLPRRASGNRLREHLGLSDVTYEAIEKRNLCTGRWSMKEARENALKLRFDFDVIVCFGSKVRVAISGPQRQAELFKAPGFFESARHHSCTYVTLPHPSGLNQLWNVPGARERAREVLRSVAPAIPWGEE